VPHCIGAGSIAPVSSCAPLAESRGRLGGINTEYCSIHPESTIPTALARIWDAGRAQPARNDRSHPQLQLAGRCRALYGASHSARTWNRATPRGPSQYASEFETLLLQGMDLDDIAQVQQYYVDAAIRSRDAGFESSSYGGTPTCRAVPVEVLQQAHRPLWRSSRTGALLDRALEKVRNAVGKDCAIPPACGRYLYGDAGVEAEVDGVASRSLPIRCGSVGHRVGDIAEWGGRCGSVALLQPRPQVPWTRIIKPWSPSPCWRRRFTDPEKMTEIVDQGLRRHHWCGADPRSRSVAARRKSRRPLRRHPRLHRLQRLHFPLGDWRAAMICTQNATAGEEVSARLASRALPEERLRRFGADRRRRTVGSECARVLMERGYTVHLYDSAAKVAATSIRWHVPGLGEWGYHRDYRELQINSWSRRTSRNQLMLNQKR